MKNDFCTVTGPPENGGTDARLNAAAAQLPTGVPANGGPTTAVVARPLGANVTLTRPLPVGPPGLPHPDAAPAAPPSAERAALTSNSAPPFFSSFFSSSLAVLSSFSVLSSLESVFAVEADDVLLDAAPLGVFDSVLSSLAASLSPLSSFFSSSLAFSLSLAFFSSSLPSSWAVAPVSPPEAA